MTMVTGFGPQLKVMRPPAATAVTTASEVQLAAVPVPITRVGCEVSTARAFTGTPACPFGFPAAGPGAAGVVVALGPGVGDAVEAGPELSIDVAGVGELDDHRVDGWADPQPAMVISTATVSDIG